MGVVPSQTRRGFGDPERLRGDSQTRAVHQRQDVGDQPALPFADQPARRVVEDHFARRRTVNPKFALQVADPYGRPAVGDEEGKPPPVADLRLAARQNQQDFAAPVGDEPLDPVQMPVPLGILLGAHADRLQIAPGIRFGQNHRAGHLARGEFRQIFIPDFVRSERVDRVGDPLQAEHVHERAVGAGDDFGRHRVDENRTVESAVFTRQGESHQVGLGQAVEIRLNQRMESDRLVRIERVPLGIDRLGAREERFGGHFAGNAESFPVIVDDIVDPPRQVIRIAVRRLAFLELGDLLHVEVIEEEAYIIVVFKKVSHRRLLPSG